MNIEPEEIRLTESRLRYNLGWLIEDLNRERTLIERLRGEEYLLRESENSAPPHIPNFFIDKHVGKKTKNIIFISPPQVMGILNVYPCEELYWKRDGRSERISRVVEYGLHKFKRDVGLSEVRLVYSAIHPLSEGRIISSKTV